MTFLIRQLSQYQYYIYRLFIAWVLFSERERENAYEIRIVWESNVASGFQLAPALYRRRVRSAPLRI